MGRALAGALGMLLLGVAACSQQQAVAPEQLDAPTAARGGCLAGGEGQFEAHLRGALEAQLRWSNAQMQCDGGPRPDGEGLRVVIAGPLEPDRRLRFILGIDLRDVASGPAQALPTNLTVMVEDEALLYATRGSDKCAVEDFVRMPLGDGTERVSGRGYCLDPASDLAGESRLLVPTFSFTALVHVEADDAEADEEPVVP